MGGQRGSRAAGRRGRTIVTLRAEGPRRPEARRIWLEDMRGSRLKLNPGPLAFAEPVLSVAKGYGSG